MDEQPSKQQQWPWAVGGVALAAVTALFLVMSPDADGDSGNRGGGSGGGDEYGARDVCEQFVSDRLVSPSSADFDRPNVTESSGLWTVTGSVDADNRMGAAIRVDYECVVRHTGGDDYRLVELDHAER